MVQYCVFGSPSQESELPLAFRCIHCNIGHVTHTGTLWHICALPAVLLARRAFLEASGSIFIGCSGVRGECQEAKKVKTKARWQFGKIWYEKSQKIGLCEIRGSGENWGGEES